MSNLEIFNEIYEEAKELVEEKGLSLQNIVSITTKLMQMVERIHSLSGPEKKKMVIDVLLKLIDESDVLDEETEQALQSFIEITLPGTIDIIIAASKNQFDINSVKKRCSKLKEYLSCKCLRGEE